MKNEGTTTVLELQEIDSSIKGMKELLDNTPLNIDQLHDSTQTFLEGLRGRLLRVINDVQLMDDTGHELIKTADELRELMEDYHQKNVLLERVFAMVKKQEGKKGRHQKLSDIIKTVEAELKAAAEAEAVSGQPDDA